MRLNPFDIGLRSLFLGAVAITLAVYKGIYVYDVIARIDMRRSFFLAHSCPLTIMRESETIGFTLSAKRAFTETHRRENAPLT